MTRFRLEQRNDGAIMATASQASKPEAKRAWKDVLEYLLPTQGAWSEQEYLVLTGRRARLAEYTDGFVEALPMPTDRHQAILMFLSLAFSQFFKSRGVVRFAPMRLRLRPNKLREPDLLLLLDANDPRRHNLFWDGADLTLEVVSEDDPNRDLIDKRADYAEGKIPEYWIVNPMTETITVLKLRGKSYTEAGVYKRGESAKSVLRPKFSVDVSSVFDAAKK